MPLVLAQLLIQFQKPIDVENPLQNATDTNSINDTLLDRLNNTTLDRHIRSIAYGEDTLNGNNEARIKERFVSPEFPTNGKTC